MKVNVRREPSTPSLEDHGFVRLARLADASLLAALRGRIAELFEEEGASAGSDFKQEEGARRLANLVNKGEVFREILLDPRVAPYIASVLGPDFKLSSLNARSASPGASVKQPLHSDMNAIPDDEGPWVCNVVWMLDDFTETNGAMRAVPGTHVSGLRPQEALEDPVAEHPQEVLVTGQAGDVVVMNAHLWHAGMENRSGAPRLALHAFYCRRDKPQQQYQKKMLSPEVQESMTPELRRLLALDDPLNDELSSQDVVRSGFMK